MLGEPDVRNDAKRSQKTKGEVYMEGRGEGRGGRGGVTDRLYRDE